MRPFREGIRYGETMLLNGGHPIDFSEAHPIPIVDFFIDDDMLEMKFVTLYDSSIDL